MKTGFYLSIWLGLALSLGGNAQGYAQEGQDVVDFQATSAIPKEEASSPKAKLISPSNEATASIQPHQANEGEGLFALPANLVGRWTVKSVRTNDDNLRKIQKLLLNPAVLTLRENGQFTMTAGCTHNTGTIRWSEDQVSLGMVLSEESQCNKAQKQLEERILHMLNQVSQLHRKDADKVSFRDENGRDLITLSRVN